MVEHKHRAGRSKDIRWDVIRAEFLKGKIFKEDDGSYITEDYTFKEIANKFEIDYVTLVNKARAQNWKRHRQAYLSRIEDISIQEELGYIDTVEYTTEVNTLNACDKIATIIDTYLESRFGELLDLSEDSEKEFTDDDIENIVEQIDMSELKDAMKLVSEMYNLQKKVTRDTKADNDKYKRNKPSKSLSSSEIKQRLERVQSLLDLSDG